MYIIDQIEQIYDRSLTGTPDEVTAAYLLANLRSVPSTSLSEMSREIGVSKGYLSGFFSRMTSEGTFASFQNALEQELGYSMPDSSQLIVSANRLEGHFKNKYQQNVKEIREMTQRIQNCESVYLIGKSAYRGMFTHFFRVLWASSKYGRYFYGDFLNAHPEELEYITDKDLVLILSVNNSTEDFRLKTAPTNDILGKLLEKECQIWFFGADRSQNSVINVIDPGEESGSFEELMITQRLASRMTEEYLNLRFRETVHKT